MRVVAIADTHLFETTNQYVPAGDVLVHAGDLCGWGMLDELRRAADWLLALPHPTKIVVCGNHDWPFARQPELSRALFDAPGVHYLQDTEVTIDGVRFWGSPWQPEFGGWAFNLPRGPALAARWRAIPPNTDVLITHGPPAGFGDRVSHYRAEGCADLLAAVERLRPRLHLFGHIHEDGGAWQHGNTWIANCTVAEWQRNPTVFDLDPAFKTAQPVAIPPSICPELDA